MPSFNPAQIRRRMERVRVLLATNDDAYDGAISRQETAGSKTGFGDPRELRKTCGHCGGEGCLRCEKGRVTVTERDPYDNGEKGFWAGAKPKTMSTQEVDRVLARLEDDEARREGILRGRLDFGSSLLSAESRDRRGSYEALRRALTFLPSGLSGEAVIEWLAIHMPGSIRVPRWAYERELDGLADETDRLRKDGWLVPEIATVLGIPRRQVKALLRQRKSP